MKKSVIYFQFDKEHFFKYHYQKGYFNYKNMGFGKVCEITDDVITQIEEIISRDLQINDFYLKRTQDFFPLHDMQNCQRIYNEIVK